MSTWSIRWIVMLGLLGVVRPRVAASALGRSRQAVLDILGYIFLENLLTQHGPSDTSIGLLACRDHEFVRAARDAVVHAMPVVWVAIDQLLMAGAA
jgi:hypothetical protein